MTHRCDYEIVGQFIICTSCLCQPTLKEMLLALRATQALTAEMAREALNRLPDAMEDDYLEATALDKYASILEGK